MALSKKYRLPLRFERNRIDKEGHPVSGRLLTVIVAPHTTDIDNSRFAILVSKKISLLAVKRNLLRRHISEAIQSILPLLTSRDYLVIPKKNALDSSVSELKNDLLTILHVKSSN